MYYAYHLSQYVYDKIMLCKRLGGLKSVTFRPFNVYSGLVSGHYVFHADVWDMITGYDYATHPVDKDSQLLSPLNVKWIKLEDGDSEPNFDPLKVWWHGSHRNRKAVHISLLDTEAVVETLIEDYCFADTRFLDGDVVPYPNILQATRANPMEVEVSLNARLDAVKTNGFKALAAKTPEHCLRGGVKGIAGLEQYLERNSNA